MANTTHIHIPKVGPIPALGLGTWKLKGDQCTEIVTEALQLGYRHIDTADGYQNHAAIAPAINQLPRDELFITTKIFQPEAAFEQVIPSIERFLDELKTPYLDLLLIHWPDQHTPMNLTLEKMLDAKKQGLIKHMGVSNFSSRHLESVAAGNFPILTNQIEMHPYLTQEKLFNYCKSKGIIITAYRPLGGGVIVDDPLLDNIGKIHHKSSAQIILRWLIQKGTVIIPKASHIDRLKANMEIFDFELSEEEMSAIASLDRHQRFCQPNSSLYDEEP